jgi:hypothetical protein
MKIGDVGGLEVGKEEIDGGEEEGEEGGKVGRLEGWRAGGMGGWRNRGAPKLCFSRS